MRRAHAHLRLLAPVLYSVACVLSIAMLLSFPAAKVHSFRAHFRTPETRRVTDRHTFVAVEGQGANERIIKNDSQNGSLPSFFTPIESITKIDCNCSFESPSEVPLLRLLNRLKLNPSGSSGSDPLLQA
jgi:hypothetical protein